jgi:hypothetical protein
MSAPDGTLSMTPEEQVEYWMDRYFTLHDEFAELLNQLAAIQRILGVPPSGKDAG